MQRNRPFPTSAVQFDRGAPTPDSFRFLAAPDKPASFEAAVEGKKRKFAGVAYSGDVIEGHWYWDRVVFDLSTTKAPQKLPMLLGHDRDKIVGFSEQLQVGSQIDVSGILSSVTEEGVHVAKTSDEGFPWQMSVHIEPRSIEEVKAGATVTVNGRTFQGPINVFRNNVIREISFTPTGWDSQTSAVAMSHGGNSPEKESSMTEAEIKALQDKAAKFEAEAKAATEAKVKAEADAAADKAKVTAFEATQAKAAKDKREAEIKALFAKTGVAFSEESAKPYRDMDEATFATVSKQFTETAARTADPTLFEERATSGAANNGDPAALAERARVLMAAAEKEGRILPVDEAVKLAAKQAA